MGYDLRGTGGVFRLNTSGWMDLLDLAHRHGWQPAGTEAPEYDPDWDGGYFTNDYQIVTDEDASALADALEDALDDIPDEEVKRLTVGDVLGDAAPPHVRDLRVANEDANIYERWSGAQGKRSIRDFIAYCRAGSFVIG